MTQPAIPTTLPWFFSSGDNGGLITEADGTTVMYVCATVNTTAHRDLFKNLSHMVHAANQLPRLQAMLAASEVEVSMSEDESNQLRAELDQARVEAVRQNIVAVKIGNRLEGQPDQLQRVLRAVRCMIDGSQPKDLPGALAVIDSALAPAKVLTPIERADQPQGAGHG